MDRNEYIRQNVEQFHNNTVASRYQQSGLTDQSAKLNNAGFNKLMDSRGISQEARSDLKNSFSSNNRMEVRHAHSLQVCTWNTEWRRACLEYGISSWWLVLYRCH